MTDDPGVKQMLRFLLARDTVHQNMWLAAIEQVKKDGLEDMPVPEAFPDSGDLTEEYGYTYLGFSSGADAAEGRWASGPAPDGKGEFRYDDAPRERPRAGAGTGGPTVVRHQSGRGRLGGEHGEEQAHVRSPGGPPTGAGAFRRSPGRVVWVTVRNKGNALLLE
ncbi:manganese catalase family protein [Micromonospora sp. NPDC005203]|uniref:manganese catalase family protein n=1 Tax=Micromonospora sp. NPDC005203 TaxID=3364226 RepID=UPI0036A8622D